MGVDECGLVIGNEVPASMHFCRDEALRVILVLLKDPGRYLLLRPATVCSHPHPPTERRGLYQWNNSWILTRLRHPPIDPLPAHGLHHVALGPVTYKKPAFCRQGMARLP
jgi:hypothetical protein